MAPEIYRSRGHEPEQAVHEGGEVALRLGAVAARVELGAGVQLQSAGEGAVRCRGSGRDGSSCAELDRRQQRRGEQ